MTPRPRVPVGDENLNFPPRSLLTVRALLIRLVFACLLPGVAGTMLLFFHEYQDDRARQEKDTLQTARALVQTVDAYLFKAQAVAQSLSAAESLSKGDLSSFHHQAREVLALSALGTNFVLSDENGQQIANTLKDLGEALPRHGNQEVFRRVLATGKPVISDLYLGGVLHRPVMSIDVPVIVSGKTKYVLSAGIQPEQFNRILQAQNLPSDWVAAIFDSSGTIVARTHAADQFVGQKGTAEYIQRMKEVPEGAMETLTREGIPVFSMFSRSPSTHWSVGIGIPSQFLTAQLIRPLTVLTLGMLVLFAIALSYARLMGRRIARSVTALTAPALSLGAESVVAVPQLDIKEAAEVANAIRTTSDLLLQRTTERDAARRELERHREQLEAIVAERTRRLAEAHRELEEQGKQLLASHDFVNAILNSVTSHIAILDSDGTIIEVNTPWKRFAWSNGMLSTWTGVGSNYLGVCRTAVGEERELALAVAKGIEGVLSGQQAVYECEYPCDAPDEKRWFRMRATPLTGEQGRVVISHDDITKLKQVEQALAEGERFITAVTDNLPGLVAYWDADLRCRFANQPYVEWFGRKPQEMLGATLPELLGERLFAANEPYVRGALRGERQTFERTLQKPGGEVGYTWASYIPDIDASGKVLGFYVLVADVTELKQAELRLQELNEQLIVARDRAEAASRAKSDFVANMSHEIRTPMNAILGLSRLLKEAPLGEQEHDYVAKIDVSARSLLGILNDILDFSKIEAGRLELEQAPLLLEEVLNNTSVIVAANAQEKGVSTAVNIAPDVPNVVIGDSLRLQQVLLNLAANAVKFTERGEVVISVRKTHETDKRVTLEFSVRDTGIGIAPDHRVCLFEAFSQADSSTSRRYGGTGLGLAISSRLVALMGGTISVTSEVGQGSDFRFTATFGVLEGESSVIRPLAATASSFAGRLAGLRILLVEDNEVNQQVACAILRRAGATVGVANDGRSATKILEQGPENFDAVLMDIQMPIMDGYAATQVIREQLKLTALPIIAMTANAMAADRERAARAGMNAHVPKPINVEELIAILTSLVPKLREQMTPADVPSSQQAKNLGNALPPLPGLDLQAALTRLDGDHQLWLSLMRHFAESGEKDLSAVRRLLATGMVEEMAATIHGLRGVAANLGAVEVARLATDLEARLKEGKQKDLPHLIDQLEQAMLSVVALAHSIPLADQVTLPASGHSPSMLESLTELQRLLSNNDLDAITQFQALRPALEQAILPAVAEPLALAIETLDFVAAEKLASEAIRTIEQGGAS